MEKKTYRTSTYRPNSNQNKTRPTDIAQPHKCPTCKSLTWQLFVNGILTLLDPELLQPLEELQTRINRAHTYSIHQAGRSFTARFRSVQEIIRHPSDSKRLTTHTHRALPTTELPTYFPARHTYHQQEEPQF
jgi:hypothetical protein